MGCGSRVQALVLLVFERIDGPNDGAAVCEATVIHFTAAFSSGAMQYHPSRVTSNMQKAFRPVARLATPVAVSKLSDAGFLLTLFMLRIRGTTRPERCFYEFVLPHLTGERVTRWSDADVASVTSDIDDDEPDATRFWATYGPVGDPGAQNSNLYNAVGAAAVVIAAKRDTYGVRAAAVRRRVDRHALACTVHDLEALGKRPLAAGARLQGGDICAIDLVCRDAASRALEFAGGSDDDKATVVRLVDSARKLVQELRESRSLAYGDASLVPAVRVKDNANDTFAPFGRFRLIASVCAGGVGAVPTDGPREPGSIIPGVSTPVADFCTNVCQR